MEVSYILRELDGYLNLLKGRNIALWGIGGLGNAFLCESRMSSLESKYNTHIICFDNVKSGFENIETIREKSENYYVIVSFLKGYKKAMDVLNNMGYTEILDYICLGKIEGIAHHPVISQQVYEEKTLYFPKVEKRKGILSILGNGPSLDEELRNKLDFFSQNDCMCVNAMASTSYYIKIKPRYYVMIDPCFWRKSVDFYEERSRKIFDDLIQKTSWDIILFLPVNARNNSKLIEKIEKNQYIRIIYIYISYFGGIDKETLYYLYDKGLAMPCAQNVLVAALFLGIRIGYKTIDLYGAEHSWIKNMQCTQDGWFENPSHFYDENSKEYTEPYVYADTGIPMTTYEIFSDFAKMFKGYEEVQEYAEHKGVSIFNRTRGSFIDAFPRQI